MDDEGVYLLDLCDEAIGHPALRSHALDWLREDGDPDAPPACVDAWYPQIHAIVLLTRGKEETRSRVLAETASGYRVDVLEVPQGWVERDGEGVLRRLPRERERIAELLGSEAARRENRVWPGQGVLYGVNVGDLDFDEEAQADEAEWEDDDWDDDDWGDEEDDDEPRDANANAEAQRYVAAPDEALGWRGRSVALVLLEAVTLSRRVFAVQRTEAGLSQAALEVLLVMLVASAPPVLEPEELTRVLSCSPHDVDEALRELEAAACAFPAGAEIQSTSGSVLGTGVDREWTLSDLGRDIAADWIARVLPIFAGWPPDAPDVDDGGGIGA